MTTGKTIALTRGTFVDKVISLLFNMLSKLVITFLPRSKHLLISWLVKAMVFLVVMYGCESWTIKEAESRRIAAFELWCWRRLLRVPGLQGDPTSPS